MPPTERTHCVTLNPRPWKQLPSDITAAHRELVTALREIRECSPRTQAKIAKDAHQEPTTLSNHLNGGRIPEETLLRDFHAVVEKDAAGLVPLPHTLDALLELREHAKRKHCECCAIGYPGATDQAAQEQPASRIVTNPDLVRARRLRRRARRREISVPQEQIGVPVPLRGGPAPRRRRRAHLAGNRSGGPIPRRRPETRRWLPALAGGDVLFGHGHRASRRLLPRR